MNFLVSSQNLRNSELFKRLYIQTARETDIVDDTGQSIQTENIVDCGVSCSSEETCSGLQYNTETKVCKKMKKVDEMFPIIFNKPSCSYHVSRQICWRLAVRNPLRSTGGTGSLRPVLPWGFS